MDELFTNGEGFHKPLKPYSLLYYFPSKLLIYTIVFIQGSIFQHVCLLSSFSSFIKNLNPQSKKSTEMVYLFPCNAWINFTTLLIKL